MVEHCSLLINLDLRRQSIDPLTSSSVNTCDVQLVDNIQLAVLARRSMLAITVAAIPFTIAPLPPTLLILVVKQLGRPIHDRGL